MIEIYNEVGYIKNVLRDGIGKNTDTDVRLLARYYKQEGITLKEATERIREKVNNYCTASAVSGIEKIEKQKNSKSIVNSVYRDKTIPPLREIKKVEIPKKAVKWLLDLETNFKITEEEVKELKDWIKLCNLRVAKITTTPMNFNRIKILMTFYTWYKIEEKYLSKEIMGERMYNLNSFAKRFKKECCITNNICLMDEIAVLIRLGFLSRITGRLKNSIRPSFIYNNQDIFINIEEGEEKLDMIEEEYQRDNEKSGGDLRHPGYWLEKKKMGSFVCQKCGKEFAHYNKSPREMGRKYCKECARKTKLGIKHNEGDTSKIINCECCGKELEVPVRGNVRKLCNQCWKEHMKELWRKSKEKTRNVLK